MPDINKNVIISRFAISFTSLFLLVILFILIKARMLTNIVITLLDWSFYILPIVIILLILCYAYTIVFRDFKKLSLLYAILILLFSIGMMNIYMEFCLKSSWGITRHVYFLQAGGIFAIVNFLNWQAYKKCNTKWYLPFILLILISLIIGYSWIMRITTIGFP